MSDSKWLEIVVQQCFPNYGSRAIQSYITKDPKMDRHDLEEKNQRKFNLEILTMKALAENLKYFFDPSTIGYTATI